MVRSWQRFRHTWPMICSGNLSLLWIVINEVVALHRLEFSRRRWAAWTWGIADTRARPGLAETRNVVLFETDSRVAVDLVCHIRAQRRTTTRSWITRYWKRTLTRDTKDRCPVFLAARATFITTTLTQWRGTNKFDWKDYLYNKACIKCSIMWTVELSLLSVLFIILVFKIFKCVRLYWPVLLKTGKRDDIIDLYYFVTLIRNLRKIAAEWQTLLSHF